MLRILVFILCFCINVAQAKFFGAEEFYLDNGLRVVVVPNHKAPVVKQMLWYKVGSIDEPLGKGGLAHLLEHLMFRGTKNVKDSAFNDVIQEHGGESNAFTSYDFTVYHEFIDISRLEVVMALEADRMQNLVISDEAFETERKIVFQERKERVSNSPFARFGEVMTKTLWQNNPYARPITGLEEEINSLTKEDVVNFYNTYYTPDNAILVLAGDIDVSMARKLADKYFSKIPTKKNIRKKVDFDIAQNASFELRQNLEEIKQARYTKKYIIPHFSDNMEQAFALMVFSNYYGESANSYLRRNYVLTNKLLSAGCYYSPYGRGQGTYSISVVTNNDDFDFDKMINTSLSDALQNFNEKKLEEEKQKILASFVYVLDNPEDAASIVGSFAALGFKVSEIENYAQYIKDVKLEDVIKIVEYITNQSTSIKATLLPM